MNHIKNILDENRKIEAQELYNEPLVETDGRVYKPSYTIEFNREGEVLLYSCDPIKHVKNIKKSNFWLFFSNIFKKSRQFISNTLTSSMNP